MKRYFWAKIPTDFFSQAIPKKLKRLPNGTELQLLYLRLILLALPENGKIEFLHLEDSVEEEIALSLDADVEGVTALLSVLERAGVWEANEDGCFLSVVPSLCGSETSDAQRKREARSRTNADNVRDTVDNVPTMSDAVPVVEKNRPNKIKTDERSKKSQEENSSGQKSLAPSPASEGGDGDDGFVLVDRYSGDGYDEPAELPF